MCIGIPQRLRSVDGIVGRCDDGTAVDLSLVPECRPGDWVLGFLGTARRTLDEEGARLILDALDAIAGAMHGGVPPDAFADLTGREPTLPPHLAAAHAAGRSEA